MRISQSRAQRPNTRLRENAIMKTDDPSSKDTAGTLLCLRSSRLRLRRRETTRKIIEDILKVEEEHAEDLKSLLEKIS